MLQSAQQNFRHKNTNSSIKSRNGAAARQNTIYACRNHVSAAMLWLCCFCCFILLCNINKTIAVPMSLLAAHNFGAPLLQRSVRDTSIAAASTIATENSSSTTLDQPADQCLIDGVLMARSNVFCEPKMGCRAIQKTGHCCPDYKCDCERDGKVYANGDKLVDPETPCTVCYCKGGEILCSPVTCFQDVSCTPKYIPGRCCPEYDNCPVAMSESSTSANWTQSPPLESTASGVTSTPLPDMDSNHQEDEKPKITIKEITKPTEIRIVNSNKAIPIQHQLSKASQLNVSQPTEGTVKHEATNQARPTTNPSTILSPVTATTKKQSTILSTTSDDIELNSSTARNQQESITVLSSVSAADVANKVNIKREYLFGREGGLPLFNIGFNNENSVANPAEEPETAGSDNVYHIVLTTEAPHASSSTDGSFVDLAPSTEGIGVDTTEGPPVNQTSNGSTTPIAMVESVSELDVSENSTQSTEHTPVMASSSISSTEEVSTQRSSTDGGHYMNSFYDEATLPVESNPAYPSLPEDDFSLRDVNFPLSETDDIGEPDEQRSIGGSHHKKVVAKSDDAAKLAPSSGSIDGSGDGDTISTEQPLSVGSSSTPMAIAEESSEEPPAKVAFMLSSREDSSEEVHISNITDFNQAKQPLIKEPKSVEGNGTDDSQELESLECLAGSSGNDCYSKLLNNTRESTTPRPTRATSTTELDIDELAAGAAETGSGDGSSPNDTLVDPKLDAESLKFDEKDDNGIATIDAPTKASVLSIGLTYPAQDKTIIESDSSAADGAKVESSGRLQLHRVFI